MAAFSETKVTEAAVHLLRLRDGKMSYLKLLKLLYLADREALHRWGVPSRMTATSPSAPAPS